LKPPIICKKVKRTLYEKEVLSKYPKLEASLININEKDEFNIKVSNPDEIAVLKPIETPGHKIDHLSFGLYISNTQSKRETCDLFAGDTILGTPSVIQLIR
jgi:glyoxylase-like metal-dependent hydrolase (beta-lactamase superfamily II)